MKKILYALFAFPLSLFAAQESAPVAPSDHGFTQTLVMVVMALAFFYFILWRPEQKRRKTMEAQRSAMKKGDRVVAMGIVGTISKINDETVIIKTADAEVEFLKAAISEVQSTDKKD